MARAHQQNQSDRANPIAEPPSTLGGPVPPIAGAARPPAHALGTQLPDGKTFVETIDGRPPEDGAMPFDPSKLAAQDGTVLPRTRPERDFNPGVPREPPPVVDKYLVMQDCNHTSPRFPRGKVVDTLNYDVKLLLRNGVKLKKLERDKDGNLEDPAEVLLAN